MIFSCFNHTGKTHSCKSDKQLTSVLKNHLPWSHGGPDSVNFLWTLSVCIRCISHLLFLWRWRPLRYCLYAWIPIWLFILGEPEYLFPISHILHSSKKGRSQFLELGSYPRSKNWFGLAYLKDLVSLSFGHLLIT